jgi:gliding motility-associated-like protein
VDTQPGFFSNNVAPAEGGSYVSLVTRQLNPPGTVETVWADLLIPFEQFSTYTFTVDLSLSDNFQGSIGWDTYYFDHPCVLQIFGFNGDCASSQDRELLWQSAPLTNFGWQTFTVSFSPSLATFSKMAIRPFFTPENNYQNSAVLVYNLVHAQIPDDPVPAAPEVPATNSLFIPNVFSPNGDKVNATFQISGTNITEVDASIFDRWGKLVHILTTESGGWTGVCGDGACPDGIYYYSAHVVFRDGETRTTHGTITLLR